MTSPKLAYSYIRFSSEAQKQGQSVQRQSDLATKWCKQNNAVLDTTLNMSDLGVSAFKGKNLDEKAALGGFIEAVKQGRVPKGTYLLIESLDRLSRLDVDAAFQLFRSILLLGVNIVTLSDNKTFTKESLTSFTDIIVTLVVMSRANEESQMKSMRLRKKWEGRRQNIKVRKIATKYPCWLSLSGDYTTFTPINERVAIINKLFTDYSSGTGVVTIASELNKAGVECFGVRKKGISKTWRTYFIQSLLKNRALLGEYQPHKRGVDGKKEVAGVSMPDYFPQVVKPSLFNKVQFLLGKVQRDTKAKVQYGINLFAGKVYCPYCGERMFVAYQQVSKVMADGSRKRYRNVRNLTCMSAKTGKCINIAWKLEDFEAKFLASSTEIQALLSKTKSSVGRIGEEIAQLTDAVKVKQKAITNLQTLIESADEVPDGAMKRWKELEAERNNLQQQLTTKEGELQVSRVGNPFTGADKVDLSNFKERARLRRGIEDVIDKIYVFFAGSKFNYAKCVALQKKMKREGANPTAIAYNIRETGNIVGSRFFVAHLNVPGKDRRLVYPRYEAALADVSSLPD